MWLAAFVFLPEIIFAVEKKEVRALTQYIIAQIYENEGSIDKAISGYKEALRLDPENYTICISLASAYLKKNDIAQAIDYLHLAARINPEAVEAHAVLALLYLLQNKQDLAAQEYELAIKNASRQDPKNTTLYKSLGFLYLKQNRLTDAESVFKMLIQLAPSEAEGYFFLAVISERMNNKKATEEYLKKALQVNPDYAEALNYLGYFYVEEGRNLAEAEKMIRKALQFDPDNGAYIDSLGWLYFKQGKLKEARQELERAASLIEDAEVYEHLGDVNFKLGDWEKTRENWQKSLELDPQRESVKIKLKNLPQEALVK